MWCVVSFVSPGRELGGSRFSRGMELVVGVSVVRWWIGNGSSRAEAATKLQLTRLQVIPAAGADARTIARG